MAPATPLRLSVLGFLACFTVLQGMKGWNLTLSPYPVDPVAKFHWTIARALERTGLKSGATVIGAAAGVIPYVSEFEHVDVIGLNDNVLSGRARVLPEARERYVWTRRADVYIGHEPPATSGTSRSEDDPNFQSPYIKWMMTRPLSFVEDRMYLQDPGLLYARMRELRDHWVLVGQREWPLDRFGIKVFLYVRRDSANADILMRELRSISTRLPDQIQLSR
ncbi:MAG: hypothetical protein QOD06_2401, partial [Candidatus Binatota bacterium]|nr:hypothetical protein [Candidatus Binatota bacterium]